MIWALIVMCIAGNELNIRQVRRCFLLWNVANACLVAHNLSIGEWAQAALFAVYFAQSVRGWLRWK